MLPKAKTVLFNLSSTLIGNCMSELLLFSQESSAGQTMADILNFVGNSTYLFLALDALLGAYCVIIVWVRVNQKRFKTETEQNEFLQAIEKPLLAGDFNAAHEICAGDPRAVCQLATLAIENRKFGYSKVRQMVLDRFQRDILADLENRLSWINTVIKTAPMLGLFGTVVGMMGAFAKLAGADAVKASELAYNIQIALITTACGLAITIPLLFFVATVVSRIKTLEESVTAGLNEFFETLRESLGRRAA
jgi:biopolymer transport protein ExbB